MTNAKIASASLFGLLTMDNITVTSISTIIGIAIGIVIGRISTKNRVNETKLSRELDQAREEHNAYQQQVNQHLAQTVDLVNNLSQECQHIQEHMFSSAKSLQLEPSEPVVLQPNSHFIRYHEKQEQPKTNSAKTEPNTELPKDYAEPKHD